MVNLQAVLALYTRPDNRRVVPLPRFKRGGKPLRFGFVWNAFGVETHKQAEDEKRKEFHGFTSAFLKVDDSPACLTKRLTTRSCSKLKTIVVPLSLAPLVRRVFTLATSPLR